MAKRQEGPLKAVIVGAGHRSILYASYSEMHPEELQIVGVADPDPVRVASTAARFNIPPENCYETAADLVKVPRFADIIINGTMDSDHVPTAIPLLEAGYDMLLEKPISTTQEDLLLLWETAQRTGRKVVICHVLRYAPFYAAIHERVKRGDIGKILTMSTAEHISYHHIAVVYVRGKWNRVDTGGSTLLMAKCCHDLDLLTWMKEGVRPAKVASFGNRMYFRPVCAPEGAGTRCLLDCPIERNCVYSARKHYLEMDLWEPYVWHDLEYLGNSITYADKEKYLRETSPYGRCVWHCDNDIVDHQVVNVEFEDGTIASHVLSSGNARPCRQIKLVGTKGEIEGTMEDLSFVVRHPDPRPGHEYTEERLVLDIERDFHGGGDLRLVAAALKTFRTGDPSHSTSSLANSIDGHLIGFAADRSRVNGKIEAIPEL
ncbi:MAG: Gfo/Idh/MocA family oxidoreductase [Clostridiaceae bacterium]|mgnify:FL=1|nr:Gfo/Idh/MocA family oxidoreductase [Clostridiaceae bacterium]